MKKLIILLSFVVLLNSCSKKDQPNPQRKEFEMTFEFVNAGQENLPLVEMQAVTNYPDEKNTHSSLLNKLDINQGDGFEIRKDGQDNTSKVYEGCRVWQIIHVREGEPDGKYLETIWVTPSHLVSSDKITREMVFSWPSDTLTAMKVSRSIKESLQDVEKFYPLYFYK